MTKDQAIQKWNELCAADKLRREAYDALCEEIGDDDDVSDELNLQIEALEELCIDTSDMHDWESLAYGFFLACGLSPPDAIEAARKVDY